MKQHSKWVAVAAVAATAVALAGCSTSGGGGNDGDQVLTISWQSDAKPALDQIIEKFEEANPGVTVKTSYAAPMDLQQQMRVQLAAGTYADVFWVWPGNGNVGAVNVIAPAGYLADLSDQPWADQMAPAVKEVASSDGKVYSLMLETTSYGAMYNDQALEETGLSIPTTWSEVLQFCSDARAAGKVAYSMGTATNYETQNTTYALSPELVQGGNPGPDFDALMAAGETTFADSGWMDVLDKSVELQNAGCFNDGFQGTDVDEANRLWATGEAIGRIGIGVYVKQVEGLTENTFTLAPLPATDDADASYIGYTAFGGGAVNADSKNLELAKKFLAFLGTPEMNALYVDPTNSGGQGTVPVITDPSNPPAGQFAELMIQFASEGRAAVFPDQNWPNPEVQANMYTGMQDLFNGRQTPQQVLDGMQAAYDQGAAK